jgi:electron transfer flavoprotein alpha subunit
MSGGPILVVVDAPEGSVPAHALECIGLALRLAAAAGSTVEAVLYAAEGSPAARELVEYGVARVHCPPGRADCGPVEHRVGPLASLCRDRAAIVVLVPHGTTGMDLVPRLGFRLGGAAITGCVDASIENDVPLFTRPCHGGTALEQLEARRLPALVSVRAGVCETPPRDPDRSGEILQWAADPDPPRQRVTGRRMDPVEGIRLEDARIIVAGGRGLEGPDGFRVLETLAATLGGAVGASRVPCDLGWCPHSWQIGLTGKTVTPDVYFAIGISGAGHHMAGCGGARTIVAINTDAQASIFADARFGVVGDYRKIVPALTEAIGRVRSA